MRPCGRRIVKSDNFLVTFSHFKIPNLSKTPKKCPTSSKWWYYAKYYRNQSIDTFSKRFYAKINTPASCQLVDLNGIPLKNSMGWVFEITRCLKFSWYRDLGGMGVRFVVEYNVSWCCYNNPSGIRWNPYLPRRSRLARFGTADFPSNFKLFLVQHNI